MTVDYKTAETVRATILQDRNFELEQAAPTQAIAEQWLQMSSNIHW